MSATATPMTALRAALHCVAKGWFLLPIAIGKKDPDLNLMSHWGEQSTNNIEFIKSWFIENDDRPYAIDLGKSGLTVLDFDEGEVPRDIGIPDTMEVSSGRGVHVYLRGTMPQSKLVINGKQVGDIKSAGGYVLGPFSPHPSGAIYTPTKGKDIADLDGDWAVKTLVSQNRAPVDASINGPKIPRGSHDNELHRVAGWLRHIGLEQDGIEYVLMNYAENRLENPGSDWQEMVKKHAQNICKKPVGNQLTAFIGSSPQSEEWDEVKELDDKLSPVAPFDPEFLPDSLRAWAVDVSERMSVPLDFTGICAIEAAAGVIGRRVFIYPKAHDKSWKESVALSGMVVADSGKMKTPTWKAILSPIFELNKEWQAAGKAERDKYDKAYKEWERLDSISRSAASKGKPAPDVPPPPDEPKSPRELVLNDVTPEAAHVIMKDNPVGVFYFRDEMSGWIAELDKDGREGQRPMFLAAMNGDDDHSVGRITREAGTATMCLSAFGGIQPNLLRAFLGETKNIDDGTVPRFSLITWPDDVHLPLIDRAANDGLKQQFRSILRLAAAMQENHVTFNFDPEAQKVFNAWLEPFMLKTNRENNLGKRSHLNKLRGALVKIAGLYQLVDILATEGSVAGCRTIDAVHLNRALRFLAYLETHMHRVYDSAQGVVQQIEARLVQDIKDGCFESGITFTMRTIQRKGFYTHFKPYFIDLALESLEVKNWVRRVKKQPGPEGGRPTDYWDINPAVPRKTKAA